MCVPRILFISCARHVFCSPHVHATYSVHLTCAPRILFISCARHVFCSYHVRATYSVHLMCAPRILFISCARHVFCSSHVRATYSVHLMCVPRILFISCACHIFCSSHPPWANNPGYLAKGENIEASRYPVLISLLSLPSSYDQINFSEFSSPAPSAYIIPLICDTRI